MRKRISPATLIASVALFFSLGGASLAASHYLITSIHQIKPSVRGQLRGAQGPQGPAGPAGVTPVLPPTVTGINAINGPAVTVPAGESVTATSSDCPSGVVSGGGYTAVRGLVVTESRAGDKQWVVTAYNPTGTPHAFSVQMECASVG